MQSKTIKIYDILTGELKSNLIGHKEVVKCLTLISNKNYLASGSGTSTFFGTKPLVVGIV